MIPKHNSCRPPTNKNIDTIEGHPLVGSPKIRVRITMTIKAIPAPRQERAPTIDAKFKGASEKLIIPSIEYLNKLQKFQEVSPATRSRFSYDKYSVLKPTQLKIPFEKRLYSVNSRIESTICRVIKRKSLAPSIISASLILLMIL